MLTYFLKKFECTNKKKKLRHFLLQLCLEYENNLVTVRVIPLKVTNSVSRFIFSEKNKKKCSSDSIFVLFRVI